MGEIVRIAMPSDAHCACCCLSDLLLHWARPSHWHVAVATQCPFLLTVFRRSTLQQTLEAGTSVVCDRYAYSGVAFTSAKPGFEGRDAMDWCMRPDAGLPRPDVVVFLRLAPDVAKSRGGFGEERYEKEEMQNRVRERFSDLAAADGIDLRSGDICSPEFEVAADGGPLWRVVDANGTLDEVEERVKNAVQPVLDAVRARNQPLGSIWTRHAK